MLKQMRLKKQLGDGYFYEQRLSPAVVKNLDGNIAWKDPAQAQQQRERQLRQRLEQQTGVSPSAVGAELAEQQAVQETDDLQMQEQVLSM